MSENEELKARLLETDWGANCADTLARWDQARRDAHAAITALEAEVARLREALEFYADPKHHAYVKVAGCNCIEADGGDTARAALGERHD